MTPARHDLLAPALAAAPRTWVQPRELFLSWNGVATLAYRGFSPALQEVKRQVEAAVPGLKPENPGSRWPKTTLGALRDGRSLSLPEAWALRRICDELRPAVAAEEPLAVAELSAVVFRCRSLEERLLTSRFALRDDGSGPADHEPTPEHLGQVEETMAQFSAANLEEYHRARLQGTGNRESYYRETHVEATLVFDLGERQPASMDRFVEAVERELPGAYQWFEPASRHLTVRALG